ncbi:MAG: hypothetical protein ACT4PV_02595 [Planctomycetaceae bacterium]
MLLAALLAALYTLPDGPAFPTPDPAATARLARALQSLAALEGEEADRAAREIALLGERALPATVRRLNEAPAGERLLLLAAVSRMPRAAPLLEQARNDPDPAVRAWATPPPRPPAPPLQALAARYLDILGLAEQPRRREVDDELRGLDPAAPPGPGAARHLSLMRDQAFARRVQAERRRAAEEFATAGARALQSGALQPRLDDASFVAFLALLREEGGARDLAVVAVVGLGEAVAPALESFLRREGSHDPGVIARILCAVRADRGRALFERLDALPPVAQRALLALAREALSPPETCALAEGLLASPDEYVRQVALDVLLRLPAPAGRAAARALLDPERAELTAGDFRRAAELLARAGESEDLPLLLGLAQLGAPADGTRASERLRRLKDEAVRALREWRGAGGEEAGAAFLASPSEGLRVLGLDMVRERARLERFVEEEPNPALAAAGIERLLALFGADAEAVALRALERFERERGKLLAALRAAGAVEALLGVAEGADPALRVAALRELGRVERVDPRHEPRLLALHDSAEGAERKAALGALVPLATEAACRRLVEAGEAGLEALSPRASGGRLPLSVPLLPFVEGADARRRSQLGALAAAMPQVEPGFFAALLKAWEAERRGPDDEAESGRDQERARLLDGLARSTDTSSAEALLVRLAEGAERDPTIVAGTLKAAARLVSSPRLATILPALREAARAERALPDRVSPPPDLHRERMLLAGLNALAWARTDACVEDLCSFVLDPSLQRAAYQDWSDSSGLPHWALEALRHFPSSRVGPAFQATLDAAEYSGRLASLHPDNVLELVRACLGSRARGRGLDEIALPLLELLGRLPWEAEHGVELARVRFARNEHVEAARAARAYAARRASLGFFPDEGARPASTSIVRALLYEAVGERDLERFKIAVEAGRNDPAALVDAAFYLLFTGLSVDLAEAAAAEAVRLTAGLSEGARDALAAVRVVQGRHAEALVLLDVDRLVPIRKPLWSGQHFLQCAKAWLGLGETSRAEDALRECLRRDRRLLGNAKADPKLLALERVYRDVDDEFFDALFRFE